MRGLCIFVRRLLGMLALLTLVAGAAVAEENKDPHGAGGEGGAVSSVQYLELDAMTVTLYSNDLPAGMLTTRIVLQLHSGDERALVHASKLKLRDVILRELYRLTEAESRSGPRVDLDLVKTGVLRAVQKQLGPDIVEDVLVQALLRRGA
jgi:flagellar basal body-associated protein FliL